MAFLARSALRAHRALNGQHLPRTMAARAMVLSTKANSKSVDVNELLLNEFINVKEKFDTAFGILRNEKIVIDPDSQEAVSSYARIMKTIREKTGLFSDFQRVQNTLSAATDGIPDARTYYETALQKLSEIRVSTGTEDMGAEKMMMDAIDKVEKQLKKPLMRDDKKGMALLEAEFNEVYKRLGINKDDLPKLEEQYELESAKIQLQDMKKDAEGAMDFHKKRLGAETLSVDVKSLDLRNFL